MAAEATGPLPAMVTVRAPREELERSFAAIVNIQPVAWIADGLVCSPRAAPDLATAALANCPFTVDIADQALIWPRIEARLLAGWYLRGPEHAQGPRSSKELVQMPGEGFGPGGHVTTEMCLAALAHMPAAPALDVGCGSGILSQAWVHMTGREVLACDPDPATIDQAARSVEAAGLELKVSLRRALVQSLPAEDLAERVVLANLPASGHRALLSRLAAAPPGVVASGVHSSESHEILAAYRELGMRLVSASRRGRWRCWGLVAR